MAFSYKVELEGNAGFILDTDLLDTGKLGYLTTDVTQYVRSVTCRRGKSTSQDRFPAGQLTVVFDNRARVFDPDYTSSPLYGAIVPRRKIRFYAGYDANSLQSQFVGFIDDWNTEYDLSGDSTATASASDAFTVLASQTISLTSLSAETSDNRVRRVLNNSQVAWPLTDFYTEGAAITLGTANYTGNALDYILQCGEAEQGLVYVDRLGILVFLGWNYFASNPLDIWSADITFSDQSFVSGFPFSGLQTNYGTEQLYNYVTVSNGASTAISQDTTSQQTYRTASYNLTVLTNGSAQMQTLADNLVSTYKNPVYRISGIDIPIDGYSQFYAPSTTLGSAAITTIFQADFGYGVSVVWRPNGVAPSGGGDGVLIGKTITATPDKLDVHFELGALQSRSFI